MLLDDADVEVVRSERPLGCVTPGVSSERVGQRADHRAGDRADDGAPEAEHERAQPRRVQVEQPEEEADEQADRRSVERSVPGGVQPAPGVESLDQTDASRRDRDGRGGKVLLEQPFDGGSGLLVAGKRPDRVHLHAHPVLLGSVGGRMHQVQASFQRPDPAPPPTGTLAARKPVSSSTNLKARGGPARLRPPARG